MGIPENSDDDRFADLLEQVEAEIAAGNAADSPRVALLAESTVGSRLVRAAECLELLQQAWPSEKPEASEPLPTNVDRFDVLEELGRGGFGVVYLAHDPALHRQVALKVQRPETVLSSLLRKRFLQEAHATASLNHPNIVTVYDVGEASLLAWIAVEYCPGMTLGQWLRDYQTAAPPRIAAEIVAKLAEAVAYAHSFGILHRDIKPSNILLVAGPPRPGPLPRTEEAAPLDGGGAPCPPDRATLAVRGIEFISAARVKLADFGLAKTLNDNSFETASGAMIGTPAYMAPEQIESRRDQIGPPTDVYGLGMVLYELLTAQPAFKGESRAEILQHVLLADPVPPRKISPQVPRDLQAIALQAIQKAPERRYLSAAELAVDLQSFLAGKPVRARQPSILEHTWRWVRRRPAALFAAALLITVAALFVANRHYAEANRTLEGWMPISFTTQPPGARVAFVPLSPTTGEPMPEKAVRPRQRTPLRTELLPGDYFVVVALDDGRFHEVYRHVPKSLQEKIVGVRYGEWSFNSGRVKLSEVSIPPGDISKGMALIAADSPTGAGPSPAASAFYMDCHEFTLTDCDRASLNYFDHKDPHYHEVQRDQAIPVSYFDALNLAECAGKRLPTDGEYMSAVGRRTAEARTLSDTSDPPKEFGPAGQPSWDRTDTDPSIYGLESNVAEWTVMPQAAIPAHLIRSALQDSDIDRLLSERRLVLGGDLKVVHGDPTTTLEHRESALATFCDVTTCERGLGFRCVRSVKPQFLEDH